jgi:GNAT superfamily N-acetyltransferase
MIRPLRRDDRDVLRAIVAGTGMFTDDEVAIAVELMDAVIEKPAQRDYLIRVCERDGEVEGYYCIGPTPATQGTFDLYWIVVDARKQGKGTGRKLEEHAVALTREMRGRLLLAETSSRPMYEQTRAFYLRRGYREVARIREYYRLDDDLVVYAKYLTVS